MGLDYEQLVFLDAETLAEVGIGAAHQELLPKIQTFAPGAVAVEEHIDHATGSYAVSFSGTRYEIYGPELPDEEGESWGRATHALFDIVNRQLAGSSHRFYAVNGGNDLGGLFLTAAEVASAQDSLERKEDWPYIPTTEHPWYGMHH